MRLFVSHLNYRTQNRVSATQSTDELQRICQFFVQIDQSKSNVLDRIWCISRHNYCAVACLNDIHFKWPKSVRNRLYISATKTSSKCWTIIPLYYFIVHMISTYVCALECSSRKCSQCVRSHRHKHENNFFFWIPFGLIFPEMIIIVNVCVTKRFQERRDEGHVDEDESQWKKIAAICTKLYRPYFNFIVVHLLIYHILLDEYHTHTQ